MSKKATDKGDKAATWKRCADRRCGRLVKVPPDARGLGCPKCGAPLTKARKA